MSAVLPGNKIAHCVISVGCRANRGFDGAFAEAIRQVREPYDRYVAKDKLADSTWHLVLMRDDGDDE